jgi:hypothetical protein
MSGLFTKKITKTEYPLDVRKRMNEYQLNVHGTLSVRFPKQSISPLILCIPTHSDPVLQHEDDSCKPYSITSMKNPPHEIQGRISLRAENFSQISPNPG